MISSTRSWITALQRNISHDAADNVVAATKAWTFTNGAFTNADIGRIMVMASTGSGNDGVFTIASVVSATSITTVEVPPSDETFGVGVTQDIYTIDREPVRDVVSDSVNGTSKEWTFVAGNFGSSDVGRQLVVAGAVQAGNNATHVIEAIISPTVVRTDNSTTPVTEEFNGLDTTLTTLNIVALTPSTAQDAFITGTRHAISSIDSEQRLTMISDPTSGFGGSIEDIVYRITKDLSKTEEAQQIAGFTSSFGSRRVIHAWPDTLAVSINGVATKVPGYFATSVLSGLTAGLPSQAGFTNLSVAGFVGRENSDDRYNDTQLDIIAGGGSLIFTQPTPSAALLIRHQLTTDLSTVAFQELSITKNVDLIARFFRRLNRPFIGTYNITVTLFDLLKTRNDGGIRFLRDARAPRIGAPLRRGEIVRLEESSDTPDSVDMDIDIDVPFPLNNLNIKLIV